MSPALNGGVGSATRTSRSDFAAHLYVAVPSAFHPGWVVRVAIPLRMYERLGFRRAPGRDWNPTDEFRLLGYELDLA